MPANPTGNPPQTKQEAHPSRSSPTNVAVLIPAYHPDVALEVLTGHLIGCGVRAILLVDDGSPAEDRPIFERLVHHPQVHLLRHETNQGKGAALKTGIRYFLEHLSHYAGLVTADADGQHAADDVLRIARALNKSPRLAILGSRCFERLPDTEPGAGIPLRSRIGNRITAGLFRLMTRIPLSDAQTGLRGLPTTLLPGLLELPGNGYEYEMSMLVYIAQTRHPLAEHPIQTLYHDGNCCSHFRPLADSIRVLRTLLSQTKLPMPLGRRAISTAREAELNRAVAARTLRVK